MFKGQMMKELKAKGIKVGDKNGATVKLEHLKTSDIVKMFYKYCR